MINTKTKVWEENSLAGKTVVPLVIYSNVLGDFLSNMDATPEIQKALYTHLKRLNRHNHEEVAPILDEIFPELEREKKKKEAKIQEVRDAKKDVKRYLGVKLPMALDVFGGGVAKIYRVGGLDPKNRKFAVMTYVSDGLGTNKAWQMSRKKRKELRRRVDVKALIVSIENFKAEYPELYAKHNPKP